MGEGEAVEWNTAGASTVLQGGSGSEAVAINNLGDIGGYAACMATEWSSNGSILWQSPASTPGYSSEITAINAAGDAVGQDGSSAAYWSATGAETLLADPLGISGAVAMNASGYSIGWSDHPIGRGWKQHEDAIEWSPTGTATILRHLSGAPQVAAYGINNRGDVVGVSMVISGRTEIEVPTLWNASGRPENLMTFLGAGRAKTGAVAKEINNAGDICGTGAKNNQFSAWELLWVPQAGALDGGTYVNVADHHDVLAASASMRL